MEGSTAVQEPKPISIDIPWLIIGRPRIASAARAMNLGGVDGRVLVAVDEKDELFDLNLEGLSSI